MTVSYKKLWKLLIDRDMLRKKSEVGKTIVSKRINIAAPKMKEVREFLREYFDVMDVPADEDGLVGFIVQRFGEQKQHYSELLGRYVDHKYPDLALVQEAASLVEDVLSQQKDNVALIDRVVKLEEKLDGNKEAMDNVLNLENDAYQIKNSGNNYRLRTPEFYNKIGATWNRISASVVGFRLKTELVNFGENSPCMFAKDCSLLCALGYLNSKIALNFLLMLNPTLTYQVIDIQNLPYINVNEENIERIVKVNIDCEKEEWNSFETSWRSSTSITIR